MQIDHIAKKFVKQAIAAEVSDRITLQRQKNSFSSEFKISSLTSVELIKAYNELVDGGGLEPDLRFEKLIRKRGVRSTSGIASITVITKDYDCPGNCIYCPKEPEMPKSYLSNEPAIMRAILNDFDPSRQVVARLKGLQKTGHKTDKIEMIVSGGTFNFYPKSYQRSFVRSIYNGLNYDYSDGRKERSLIDAQKRNEKAKHRCVGLSIETRPDYIDKKSLKFFRELGITKVELGVQCLDDDLYRLNKRGHTVKAVQDALKLLKDAGFKVNVHFMPNMYGSNKKKDLEMFSELFDNELYRPDWLKIYPCVVVPYSPLEKIYRAGGHQPYSDRELIDLLVKFKEKVPEYCRITRLYRDIPAESIIGGSKVSNLRQYVQAEMKEKGKKCKCIRCREIKDGVVEKADMVVREYDSSSGKEYFISFEDVKNDKLIGYVRLRFPSQHFSGEEHWLPDLRDASVIREIHVFGEHISISGKSGKASQHKGYGRKLIEKAFQITKDNGLKKMAVISGVGVRDYYRKLGFKDGEFYQALTG